MNKILCQVSILHPRRYRREWEDFCVDPKERQDVGMRQFPPDKNLLIESLIQPASVNRHEGAALV